MKFMVTRCCGKRWPSIGPGAAPVNGPKADPSAESQVDPASSSSIQISICDSAGKFYHTGLLRLFRQQLLLLILHHQAKRYGHGCHPLGELVPDTQHGCMIVGG